MKLIGADISGERQSARGRADAVLQDKTGTYVFEFKYGKTPQEAMEQARTKEYGNQWLDSTLPVFYVGVNYDPAKKCPNSASNSCPYTSPVRLEAAGCDFA